VHHIDQWKRDRGHTNIALGICLCRFHHLLLHNNHWDVLRRGGDYWLRPPVSVDPAQKLLAMPSKEPLILQMFAHETGTHATRMGETRMGETGMGETGMREHRPTGLAVG
jgi:hypothetical protein